MNLENTFDDDDDCEKWFLEEEKKENVFKDPLFLQSDDNDHDLDEIFIRRKKEIPHQ